MREGSLSSAVFWAVVVPTVAGMIGAYMGVDAGKKIMAREICETDGRSYVQIDGEYQCVTVTP